MSPCNAAIPPDMVRSKRLEQVPERQEKLVRNGGLLFP